MYGETFDLLLGRRTYDLWSGFWPKAPKSPMADHLNAATKYVATHRPESLVWGPFEGVGPDLVEGVRKIKAKDGNDLILSGSSTLTSVLLEHGLADEVVLLVNPVLLGKGKRLFAEGTPPRAFALESTQALPSGIVINTFRAAGTFAEPEIRSVSDAFLMRYPKVWVSRPRMHSHRQSDGDDAPRHPRCGSLL
jgi:dihydrofolate reductase